MLEGTLKDETYRQLLREGLFLSVNIPKVAQKEILKIVAYDELTDTVGSRVISTP